MATEQTFTLHLPDGAAGAVLSALINERRKIANSKQTFEEVAKLVGAAFGGGACSHAEYLSFLDQAIEQIRAQIEGGG